VAHGTGDHHGRSRGNGYEIVGVLREVFGLSDHELAAFSEGPRRSLADREPTIGTGVIVDCAHLLASMRATILPLPPFSATAEVFILTATSVRTIAPRLPETNSTDLRCVRKISNDSRLHPSEMVRPALGDPGFRTLRDWSRH